MSSGEGGRPPRTRRRYSGISASDDGVPWAINRTAEFMGLNSWLVARTTGVISRTLDVGLVMDVLSDGLDVFDRRHRQDAVAQIEDVADPARGAFEHFVGRGEDP